MDKCGFLDFMWSLGECESISMELLPKDQYRIVERGVRIEGATADFSHCVIENIQTGQLIKGDAKINAKSSDWRTQGTIDDSCYDNVVLHIVEECDTVLLRANTSVVVTCVITATEPLREAFERLPLQCGKIWAELHPVKRADILSRLLDDRIKRKTAEMKVIIDTNDCSWNDHCHLLFFRGMGTPSGNKDEFEQIARHINYDFILIHKSHQRYIEGVLLGSIGYLEMAEDRMDQYTKKLREEYILSKDLLGENKLLANWSKEPCRPTSAPALSLIQAITILVKRPNLFSDIFMVKSLGELRNLFRVELPEYWQSHSAPSAGLGVSSPMFTTQRIDILLLNFVIPLLLLKAKLEDDMVLWHRAFDYYEQIDAERFSLLRRWSSQEWRPCSAYDSQALVQLHQQYCKGGKCGSCMVGREGLLSMCKGGL